MRVIENKLNTKETNNVIGEKDGIHIYFLEILYIYNYVHFLLSKDDNCIFYIFLNL